MINVRFNEWITCPRPRPLAQMRLFCFPYAGGGASFFRHWTTELPQQIEVCPVQLPGRENRLGETQFRDLDTLVDVIAREIRPFLNKPFLFFGHSMGALISYELSHRLLAQGEPLPERLFLSAYRAPHIPAREKPIYRLPMREFIQELHRLNGTPRAIFKNKELLKLVLPILRADFGMFETYEHRERMPLPIPVSVFGGEADEKITQADLAAWQQYTTADFQQRMYDGDHFFLVEKRPFLHEAILSDLNNVVSG